jgi:multidrug resistance efflux pump
MVQPAGTNYQDTDPGRAPGPEQPGPEQPGPEPPPPVRAARSGRLRKWRARLIVLVLLAAAVLLFLRISSSRSTEANRIDLGTVTLTAQPIPIDVPQTGVVTAVSVAAQQRVAAGQKLGTLEVTSTDAQGDPKTSKVSLAAPRAGIVVDLPATVGSTLQPGQPFLQLYDPAQLTFESDVPLEDLPELAPTMLATLKAESLTHTVRARVQRVVPRVGDTDTAAVRNPNALRVVLVPASARDVQGLVPGLRFTGYVDTVTGVPGTRRLVSMGEHPYPVGRP